MKVRIVAYNLLNGLHSSGFDGLKMKIDADRVEAAKVVLRDLRPDILIATEVCRASYNDHGIMLDLPTTFGLNYMVDHGPVSGSNHGTAILSRFPVAEGTNHSAHRRKHVRALVTPRRGFFTIDAVHPHVFLSERDRASFLESVIGNNRERHILAGDFNAYSPDDSYNKDKVIDSYRIFLDSPEEAEPLVNDLLSCKAIARVKELGMIDTYREFHSGLQGRTVPTFLKLGGDDGARMDYIFCSSDVDVVGAGIYTKDPADVASDHFPVWADIEV